MVVDDVLVALVGRPQGGAQQLGADAWEAAAGAEKHLVGRVAEQVAGGPDGLQGMLDQAAEVVGIVTLGLNLFRTLMIYLKPVIPGVAERTEAFLAVDPFTWADAQAPLLSHDIQRFKSLLERVDPKAVQAMVQESHGSTNARTEHNQAQPKKTAT